MGVARSEAVMVTVVLPGERVEVESFADGSIEIERFVSDGTVAATTTPAKDSRAIGADASRPHPTARRLGSHLG
jgi:hypothetical protein